MRTRTHWTYRGVIVWPAGPNSSGIRWTTIMPSVLRADTKAGMRDLITRSQSCGS